MKTAKQNLFVRTLAARRRSLCFVGGAVVLMVSLTASGFDPDSATYGHSFISDSVTGRGYNRWGDTTEAFTAEISYEAGGAREKIAFSDQASAQVVLGARSMDFLPIKLEGAGSNGTYLLEDDFPGGLSLKGEPFNTAGHCDDEDIVGCSRYAYALTLGPKTDASSLSDRAERDSSASLLEYAAALWLKPNATESEQTNALAYAAAARVKAGRALHIVQDLYAHSNWADLHVGSNAFVTPFGKGGAGVGDSAADVAIRQRSFPGTLGQQATCQSNPVSAATVQRIRDVTTTCNAEGFCSSAYADYAADTDLRPPSDLPGVIWTSLIAFGTRVKANILDWGNSGGNGVLASGGLNPERITSGYFDSGQHAVLGLGTGTDTAFSKCDHGFSKEGSKVAGINKDVPWAPYTAAASGATGTVGGSQATALHRSASFQAALASKQILQNIVDEAGRRANNDTTLRDTMVELFMGARPATAFVIDGTGSMQDVMDGVSQQIKIIADIESANDVISQRRFALTTYTEDSSSKATITPQVFGSVNASKTMRSRLGTSDQLSIALAALPQAVGGGDCPEPTLEALLQTIRALPRKSKVFVFTDASTKDKMTTGGDGVQRLESAEVTRLVKLKRLQVTFSLSGSCSPISPAYYQIAEATDGQVLLVDHTADDTAVAMAGVSIGADELDTVHVERGSLATGASKTVTFAVEGGVKRLVATVTNESGLVTLRDPSGAIQTLRGFVGGALLDIALPTPGNWTVSLDGGAGTGANAASAYTMKVQVAGVLSLGDIEYTSREADPHLAHSVHAPFGKRPPTTGVRVVAKLSTDAPGNPSAYAWEAVSVDGSVLGPIDMSRQTLDSYEGTAAIGEISAQATRPWRVRVRGQDAAGRPFARTSSALFEARNEVATLTGSPRYWVPGARHVVKVRVDNSSTNGSTYALGTVTLKGVGQVVDVSPPTAIGAGGSAELSMTVILPADAPVSGSGAVQASLTSSAAGGAVVYQLSLPISVQLDTDGDGVPDDVEKGPQGIDPAYDGNGDGMPDWQQAGVISMPSDKSQGYLTAELTSGRFQQARTLPADAAPLNLNLDLIDFKVVGLQPGASTQMKLFLPAVKTAQSYAKYGPLPGTSTSGWYDFAFDDASQLGSKISGNVVTLYLRDGAKGDDDLSANGEIADAGGPVGVRIASATPVVPDPAGAGGGGGGGGCTIGLPGQRDGSLVVLGMLAAVALWYRRRRARGGEN